MIPYLVITVLIQITCLHTSLSINTSYEDIFNSIFKWQPYSPSFEIPSRLPKPVMIIFYGEKCFASSRFKKELINSPAVIQLSDNFTMVKIERNQDPKLRRYRKNGVYYPRVYFISNTGVLLQGINGPDTDYKFYFATADELLEAMKKVLELNQQQQEIFDVFHEEF